MEQNLEKVRTRKGFTQIQLAEILHINQSALSKLERRTDMYVSMLRSFIQAMGGRLELRAAFPGGEVIEIGGLEGEILGELKELLHQRCRIEPIPDNQYNEFFLNAVNENVVTFQKLSNQQYVDVPTRRIAEVLPAGTAHPLLPVVLLKGSLAWSAHKKLWQFHSDPH
jgi:transcriptional regulator with XRE-family HTH domain